MTTPIRILGIDPGTNVFGFAVVDTDGNKMAVVELGVVTFKHISEEHADKLRYIFEQVQDLVQQHKPQEVAIEAPFYGKNVQSMLKLGRAQGVAIAAAVMHGLPITEYAPRRIKQAVTGNGNASKEQVFRMLEQLCKRSFDGHLLDATDALAVAVCHSFSKGKKQTTGNKFNDWSSFIKANPGRKA